MTDLVDDNSNNPAPAGTVTPVVAPTIDAPITMTPVSAGDISTPNNLARVASGSIGLPTEFTPVGAGTISTPNALSRVSAGDISTPNTLSRVTAGDISVPNTLNRIAAGSVATPNTLAPVAAQHINRVVKPIISFDFGNQIYSKDGQPQTFSDITTFSRASTATYVETYIDNLSRKQKRIATAAVNVPRFEDKGLLVEGASTNIQTFSENLNSYTGLLNVTKTVNAEIAPDGTTSGNLLVDNAVNGSHQISTTLNFNDNTEYTVSVYLKVNSLHQFSIVPTLNDGSSVSVVVDLISDSVLSISNGTSANISGEINGWKRVSFTFNSLSGSDPNTLRLRLVDGGLVSYAGSGKSIFIWGAQVEALPFATSYIRTEGSAVSRAADDISANVTPLSGQASFFTETSLIGGSSGLVGQRFVFEQRLNPDNRILFLNSPSGINALVENNNVTLFSLNGGGALLDGEIVETTLTINGSNATAYTNGVSTQTASNAAIPVNMNELQIGNTATLTVPLNGHIKRLEIYDTALTANEVKSL